LEEQYVEEINYHYNLSVAGFPIDVMKKTQQDLHRRMRYIEEREALRDSYQKVHGYATTVINDLFQKEKLVRSLFQAIEIYCLIRGKNIQQISPLIARYRAYYRLQKKIGRAIDRYKKKKVVVNAFDMEVRKAETKTPYIKVYCPVFNRWEELAVMLTSLETVRVANVAYDKVNKQSITVYPARGCVLGVTESAVKAALEAYFTGNEESKDPDGRAEM
jgi:hypothetical protein